ncbi:MAG: hypothetical protein KUG65_10055 [Sphingomonadaceae bacterium]|nr:hypothetical protein [Sphingomonadaceae bacterium]
MMRVFTISALGLALCACAVIPPPPANYRPARLDMAFPLLGSVQEVGAGEEMLAKGQVSQIRGVTYSNPVKLDQFTLTPGFYALIGEDAQYSYYSYHTAATTDGTGFIPPARDGLGAWLPAPDSIRTSRSTRETCLIFVEWGEKACNKSQLYEQSTRQKLTKRDLVQKLIYQGRDGDRITLKYWESSGHSARPESSRELTFALQPFTEIEYRGARLRILSADELKVQYVALQNFTDYWTGKRPDE